MSEKIVSGQAEVLALRAERDRLREMLREFMADNDPDFWPDSVIAWAESDAKNQERG